MDMLRRVGLFAVAVSFAACATAPTVTPSPTPTPTAQVSCRVPAGPPVYDDPCPAGIAAVRAVTASLGAPTQIVLLPGPIACGPVFPGASPVLCPAPAGIGVLPCPTPAACPDRAGMFPPTAGLYMHGWVAFDGTPKLAAVALSRAMTFDALTPVGTPGPWQATVIAFEVPPPTFVMP